MGNWLRRCRNHRASHVATAELPAALTTADKLSAVFVRPASVCKKQAIQPGSHQNTYPHTHTWTHTDPTALKVSLNCINTPKRGLWWVQVQTRPAEAAWLQKPQRSNSINVIELINMLTLRSEDPAEPRRRTAAPEGQLVSISLLQREDTIRRFFSCVAAFKYQPSRTVQHYPEASSSTSG